MKSCRSASHAAILIGLFLASGLLTGCQESAAPGASAQQPADRSRPPRQNGAPDSTPPSVVKKTSRTPGTPTRLLDLSFDDIKFEMEKTEPFQRSMLTEKIEGYAGRKIRIRGYMLPSFVKDGITRFVLVRDNMECCFGPGAALYDCVMVEMVAGKSTSYSVRPIAVTGIFSIREWRDFDGAIRAIYHLEGQEVEM